MTYPDRTGPPRADDGPESPKQRRIRRRQGPWSRHGRRGALATHPWSADCAKSVSGDLGTARSTRDEPVIVGFSPGNSSALFAVALRWSGSASPTLPPSRPAFDGIKRMLLLRPPQRPESRHDLVPAPDAAAAAGVRHVVWVPSSPAAVQPAQIGRDRAAVSGVSRGVTCASASRSALSSGLRTAGRARTPRRRV